MLNNMRKTLATVTLSCDVLQEKEDFSKRLTSYNSSDFPAERHIFSSLFFMILIINLTVLTENIRNELHF